MPVRYRRSRLRATVALVLLRPLILVLTGVALLVSGCGGGDQEATDGYVERVNAVQQRFVESAEEIGREAGDARRIGQALDRLRRSVDQTADEIGRIKAPAEVVPEHRRLVEVLRAYGRQIRTARAGVRSRDPARQARAVEQLSRAVKRTSEQFTKAIDSINAKLRS